MVSGSDDEVLEIHSFTHSTSFTKVKKRRSKRKMWVRNIFSQRR